jgi:serine/threonine protein kinase
MKCLDTMTQKLVAVKMCKYNANDGLPSTIAREVSILKGLDHPNIIKLLEVVYHYQDMGRTIYLVFPFVKEDLSKYIKRNKPL